ncbi:MAG: hypothetical protein H7125_06940 [Proteobacteria bacterium]|nr:hypothetical protein [Burkholderiales bacterium]
MPRAPDKWIEEIVALRRAGRLVEAGNALAEFRKAYPTYPLPAAVTSPP